MSLAMLVFKSILIKFISSLLNAVLQGPGCMTTETKERFKVPSASDVDLYHKTVGAIGDTGFTSNHNIEPLTFHPDYAYLNDAPVRNLLGHCQLCIAK